MSKATKKAISRRKFLSNSALAAFSFHVVPSHVLGAEAPSNKLNIAGIGIGGMGGGNLRQCEKENIVALCDVDSNYAGGAIKRYPKAKVYKDYRIMFDKEQNNIDAVVIATPDHTHAVITMEAMRRGKHVYCQKPLTHTVYEARKITEAARKYKVQTQMGNQGHSSEQIRLLTAQLATFGRYMHGPTGLLAALRGLILLSRRELRIRRLCRNRLTGICGLAP